MRRPVRRLTIKSKGTSIDNTQSSAMPNSASRASNASACRILRGKPSRINPLPRSAACNRLRITPSTMSSDTNLPASMAFSAWTPSGVPASTAARNKSPVEMCAIANFSVIRWAWVPLPDPGAPRSTTRIRAPQIRPFKIKLRGRGDDFGRRNADRRASMIKPCSRLSSM